MKADRFTKVLLCIIALLLFLNLVHRLFPSKQATAVVGNGEIRKYQIAPWMTQAAGGTVSHTGYYIPDKTTGNVVTSKAPEYCPPGR